MTAINQEDGELSYEESKNLYEKIYAILKPLVEGTAASDLVGGYRVGILTDKKVYYIESTAEVKDQPFSSTKEYSLEEVFHKLYELLRPSFLSQCKLEREYREANEWKNDQKQQLDKIRTWYLKD